MERTSQKRKKKQEEVHAKRKKKRALSKKRGALVPELPMLMGAAFYSRRACAYSRKMQKKTPAWVLCSLFFPTLVYEEKGDLCLLTQR